MNRETPDPAALMLALDNDADRLDELEAALGETTELLDQAEERWLEITDAVGESLKDEMDRQGRKGDPAAHWVESVARRQDRLAHTNYRRAKRAMDRIKEQIGAKKAAMSGRQSNLAVKREELRATPYAPQPEGVRTRPIYGSKFDPSTWEKAA